MEPPNEVFLKKNILRAFFRPFFKLKIFKNFWRNPNFFFGNLVKDVSAFYFSRTAFDSDVLDCVDLSWKMSI